MMAAFLEDLAEGEKDWLVKNQIPRSKKQDAIVEEKNDSAGFIPARFKRKKTRLLSFIDIWGIVEFWNGADSKTGGDCQ